VLIEPQLGSDSEPTLRDVDEALIAASGPLGVFSLLHDARPVLLNLGEPGGLDIAPWADRVQSIEAKYFGTWKLPAIGRSLLRAPC